MPQRFADERKLEAVEQLIPPGTDARPNDVAYTPAAIATVSLRRRSVAERSAA